MFDDYFLDGRKLEMDERPLWVQLYWGKDQREGRFVLQNAKLPKVSVIKRKSLFLINFICLDVKTNWWKF